MVIPFASVFMSVFVSVFMPPASIRTAAVHIGNDHRVTLNFVAGGSGSPPEADLPVRVRTAMLRPVAVSDFVLVSELST
jgi:hypothetical protein